MRGLGICVPGFVNPETGTSIVAENIPGWQDVRLREIFAAELSLPVVVEDSSRAYALAERWQGDGKGRQDFLLADLGYGIGMAIVVGGIAAAGRGQQGGRDRPHHRHARWPCLHLRQQGLPGDRCVGQGHRAAGGGGNRGRKL